MRAHTADTEPVESSPAPLPEDLRRMKKGDLIGVTLAAQTAVADCQARIESLERDLEIAHTGYFEIKDERDELRRVARLTHEKFEQFFRENNILTASLQAVRCLLVFSPNRREISAGQAATLADLALRIISAAIDQNRCPAEKGENKQGDTSY